MCPGSYQSGNVTIPCEHPEGHPPLRDGSGRFWRHGRGSMHWDRMADYQPPTVDTVTVPLAALRALVERARSHAEAVADEWGTGDADDPENVELRELIAALGVEGL